MRTPREFYSEKPIVYSSELDVCPACQGPLKVAYTSGAKTVQTLTGVWVIVHQPRYCYHERYLPLLACHERRPLGRLRAVSQQSGLILSLDGLCPEGGEPQLWVVRELHRGLTLRSGWLSQQDEAPFNFLRPIADWELRVVAVLSDKQRGLEPAVPRAFPLWASVK
ncbi:MAG: hypothetical protein ACUVR4_04270 [Anaerolineae bacterium]